MPVADPAEHIDIRTDIDDLTAEEYEVDVNQRYDLARHPKVQEISERIENLKEGAVSAFEEAKRLRQEAEEAEGKASKVAAGQAEGDTDALFGEAATKEQKAERKEKEGRARANALKQLVGERETKMVLQASGAVDRADRLVSNLDPVAQTGRDEVQQQAENEHRAAAEQELENLLPKLRERWTEFAELYQKARVLSTRSFGAYSTGIGPLSSGDVDEARKRLQQALDA